MSKRTRSINQPKRKTAASASVKKSRKEVNNKMNDQEQQEIKTKLIELGFWGATEQGDPLNNHRDSQTLQERLAKSLADNVILASTGFSMTSPARRVEVVNGKFIYPLVAADSYPEGICLAALALPEFLKQHPECAA